MIARLIGYVLIGISIVLLGVAFFLGSARHTVPLIFSPTQLLGTTWKNYKANYIEPSTGRTLDVQRGNITTSEGESYTMLRAVWMDDKETFDSSLAWTKNNLSRSNDRLFSWLFGQRTDGSYGVLTSQGGGNNASDADTDIALSLVFAYARWQDKNYLGDARVIASDIWNSDVITIGDIPYMTADNVEKTSTSKTALINVSYLSPYAYRIFATIDPQHPWLSLVNSSYALIGETLQQSLSATSSAGIPPDWVEINKTTGALSAPPHGSTQTTNFSYDALRLPWRLALDWQWYHDPRAKNLLEQMSFLSKTWQAHGALASVYAHDGSIIDASENPAMYGGTIGYFAVADPQNAPAVYQQKLQFLYDPDLNAWKQPLSYYDDNWAWFGIAQYNNLLPNLFASLPLQLYEF